MSSSAARGSAVYLVEQLFGRGEAGPPRQRARDELRGLTGPMTELLHEHLEHHRPPGSPRDLLTHSCLVQSSDPIWYFGKGKHGTKVKVPRTFSSNSYLVLRTAAVKGLGIVLVPFRTVRDDLKDGTLIELLKGQPIPERPLYAAFAPGAPLPEKVHSFVDFLSEWFRKHPL